MKVGLPDVTAPSEAGDDLHSRLSSAVGTLPLNSVALDGVPVRRLSAVLHPGRGATESTRSSPWWVYLGCETLPASFAVSDRPITLSAALVSGDRIQAQVVIVERRDDPYGTELILSGREPSEAGDQAG